MEKLYREAYGAAAEIIEKAKLKEGQILAVGCSTSEILGERIGSHSSPEAAEAVFRGIGRRSRCLRPPSIETAISPCALAAAIPREATV